MLILVSDGRNDVLDLEWKSANFCQHIMFFDDISPKVFRLIWHRVFEIATVLKLCIKVNSPWSPLEGLSVRNPKQLSHNTIITSSQLAHYKNNYNNNTKLGHTRPKTKRGLVIEPLNTTDPQYNNKTTAVNRPLQYLQYPGLKPGLQHKDTAS